MADTYSFGQWLKGRRRALHLTQRQLALEASCAVATVKKIEADERRPSPELAGLLADALQVAPEWRDTFIEAGRGQRPVDTLPAPNWMQSERQPGNFVAASVDREADGADLPRGTVTFLFTDIEGSSRLWEQHSGAMQSMVAQHDALLHAAVVKNGGHVVKMRGDGLHAVFPSVIEAIEAAVSGQRALQSATWDDATGPLRVRMGLHTGSAELRDGDYFGPAVNRAAHLQDAGHGGQILLSAATAGLVRPQLSDAYSLLDLGRYRIKDDPEAARIFQLAVGDLRRDFPPLRAKPHAPSNLPTQVTSFVGRSRELAEAKRLLTQGRLLTLTGPGGTGKTRLALQVATEVQGVYRDGVWLVELAPLADESMVLPAVAKIFSLQTLPGRPLSETVADFLRDKELLLLLDNCEHLIERCATLASEFLNDASNLRLLASSRESLGVPGEMILRVPSLTLPVADRLNAETVRSSEATQLLVERAAAARPQFQLTDENAEAVAEICRRLDGIPLAIELAASRLRLFSPQQIAERLSDRFRLLTGGSRTAVPRQQTLQALIDWSYDLLEPEEQELFRRLSVFAGGWTFEAAEAIGEGLDVLELLDQLVNKSLVQVEDVGEFVRYRFLETIRQYARDRLFAAGEGESVRDRHFAYFTQKAAELEVQIGGPRMEELLAKLRSETDNFRLAIEWGLERDVQETVELLIGTLVLWSRITGPSFSEIKRWIDRAAARLEEGAPEGQEHEWQRARARISLAAGQAALAIGEFEKVRTYATKSISLARAIDDKSTLMAALGYLSIVNVSMRTVFLADDQESYAAAEECLALARELKNPFYQGMAMNVMGGIELARGNERIGKAYLANAKQGSPFMSAMTLFQSAMMLAHGLNDPEAALPLLLESHRSFQRLKHPHFVTVTGSEIAHIQRRNGDLAAAKAAYRQTIAHFQWVGSRAPVAHQLESFAFIARAEGKWDRAATLLGAAELLRSAVQTDMLPSERPEYEQEVAALRREMDEIALEIAWRAGSEMSLDQAVEYALADA